MKNDYKTNPRLVELRASIILNNIYNMGDEHERNTYLWIIQQLIGCTYENGSEKFNKLLKHSINNVMLGATPRELWTTLAVFYEEKKLWSIKLNMNIQTFYNTVSRNVSKKVFNEEYMDSLVPMYAQDQDYFNICCSIASFIDNFKFKNENNTTHVEYRTLELKFWVIYNKIYNILQSQEKMTKFMKIICEELKIDYSSIAHLTTNIGYISRSMPYNIPAKHQFWTEMINMGYMYGMSKAFISENLLGRRRNLLYLNYYTRISKNILDDEYEMRLKYNDTLSWKYLNGIEITKFIDLFIKMMGYDF